MRVPLHGRRVRGWVVELDVELPPGVDVVAITKVTGAGPSPEMIELCRWASWRWAGRLVSFLRMASPLPLRLRSGSRRRLPGGAW